MADLLKKDPTLKIRLAGHTDSSGDVEGNKALSNRRAESVKNLLEEKYGADANRISTRGWGAEQPLAENQTEEGRAINRRVEILAAR